MTATLLDTLLTLAARLRAAGVAVPLSAVVDASGALAYVDVMRREEVRTALRATLVKRPEDLATFDVLFARVFREPDIEPSHTSAPISAVEGSPGTRAADALHEAALDAVLDERGDLRDVAARAIRELSGLDAGVLRHRYHLERTLRALGLARLRQEALRRKREGHERRDELSERLELEEIARRVDELRRLIVELLRAQLPPEADDAVVGAEHIDFLDASEAELRQMRQAVKPLARKLAARLARKDRRRHHGRLDMRRTLRRSMSSGGVPVDLAYRVRSATRPDLWLLCDVSGSVAEFSQFTLALLTALHEEFAGIRAFTFVDDIDDVTEVLRNRRHDIDPHYLLVRASVASGRGRSDYGRALDRFCRLHADDLRPSATVIITGDGRSHHLDAGAEHLRAIGKRVKRVYFLDPEPRAAWQTGDAAIGEYEPYCDDVFEVRNLAQLATCIEKIV